MTRYRIVIESAVMDMSGCDFFASIRSASGHEIIRVPGKWDSAAQAYEQAIAALRVLLETEVICPPISA